jgi:hypothetical protein
MNKDTHLLFEAYRKAITENAETELGHDPKDVAEYDKAKEEISFHKYPFWDAYHAVKEGAWTEDDFHQWCQTVWNDGAESAHARYPENEEVPGADDECAADIEGDGSIQPGVV